jgi:plasmid stabilization system protein ParE
MPVRAVEIHPLAAREARAASSRYGRRNSAKALRFQAAVFAALQRLGAAAELGSPFGQHFRWMRAQKFPYPIYYEIRDPQPVLVYAVAHCSRRPGYWLRRRP